MTARGLQPQNNVMKNNITNNARSSTDSNGFEYPLTSKADLKSMPPMRYEDVITLLVAMNMCSGGVRLDNNINVTRMFLYSNVAAAPAGNPGGDEAFVSIWDGLPLSRIRKWLFELPHEQALRVMRQAHHWMMNEDSLHGEPMEDHFNVVDPLPAMNRKKRDEHYSEYIHKVYAQLVLENALGILPAHYLMPLLGTHVKRRLDELDRGLITTLPCFKLEDLETDANEALYLSTYWTEGVLESVKYELKAEHHEAIRLLYEEMIRRRFTATEEEHYPAFIAIYLGITLAT